MPKFKIADLQAPSPEAVKNLNQMNEWSKDRRSGARRVDYEQVEADLKKPTLLSDPAAWWAGLDDSQKLEAIETLGEFAGGTVGAVAGGGTPASIPAAGAGAVAGKGVARGVGRVMGLKPKPSTVRDELIDAAKTFGLNAAGEGVALGAALFNPLMKRGLAKVIQADPHIAQLAENAGVQLTPGMLSQRPIVKMTDAFLENTPGGMGTIRKVTNKAISKNEDNLRRIPERFNPTPVDRTEAGQALKAQVAGNRAAIKEEFKPKYQDILSQAGDAPINAGTFRQSARDFIEDLPQHMESYFPASVLKKMKQTAGMQDGQWVTPRSLEVPPAAPRAKQLWEMGPDELDSALSRVQKTDAEISAELFGSEGGKEYERAYRKANSATDLAGARRAQEIVEHMESSLTEAQRNRLYGIGESDAPNAETLKSYRDSLNALDFNSPSDLGKSLKWAVSRLPEHDDIAKMTEPEKVAYAQMRYAAQKANELGFDPNEWGRTALRSAAERFRDPADAAFVLERFLDPKKWDAVPATAQISGGSPVLVDSGTPTLTFQEAQQLRTALLEAERAMDAGDAAIQRRAIPALRDALDRSIDESLQGSTNPVHQKALEAWRKTNKEYGAEIQKVGSSGDKGNETAEAIARAKNPDTVVTSIANSPNAVREAEVATKPLFRATDENAMGKLRRNRADDLIDKSETQHRWNQNERIVNPDTFERKLAAKDGTQELLSPASLELQENIELGKAIVGPSKLTNTSNTARFMDTQRLFTTGAGAALGGLGVAGFGDGDNKTEAFMGALAGATAIPYTAAKVWTSPRFVKAALNGGSAPLKAPVAGPLLGAASRGLMAMETLPVPRSLEEAQEPPPVKPGAVRFKISDIQ